MYFCATFSKSDLTSGKALSKGRLSRSNNLFTTKLASSLTSSFMELMLFRISLLLDFQPVICLASSHCCSTVNGITLHPIFPILSLKSYMLSYTLPFNKYSHHLHNFVMPPNLYHRLAASKPPRALRFPACITRPPCVIIFPNSTMRDEGAGSSVRPHEKRTPPGLPRAESGSCAPEAPFLSRATR